MLHLVLCVLSINRTLQGAALQVYLASSPNVEGLSGKYFGGFSGGARDKNPTFSAPASYDENLCAGLWELSEELVGGI
ncbi:hypothetical protein CYMTET_32782 [Cymbomonas tetramitiformis]|uniref:Uncharacterized protein n=1 Tax=Cymbomonas tetramitiformis TaxID=36881 RepID=A0AAE0FE58_9CHLO|nr:hypothetical protein CYMTET_32782 [Cymbomonas tetramitiformis]